MRITPSEPDLDNQLHILETALGSKIFDRSASRRHVMAHDASHFLRIPSGIVTPSGLADLRTTLRHAREMQIPVTFRSGGTSLSGQSSTAGILVDTRQAFRNIEVLDQGLRVRVQPGATVRNINNRILRHQRKLGPDPASEIACTIGGVIANNSSGMSCGTDFNTYRTLESMTFMLPSGTVIDTADPCADDQLRSTEPHIHQVLTSLHREIHSTPEAIATLTQMFRMKNTMGYGLNSFLDFSTPVDILSHLIIGSEGTLAFVAEAVFRTVPIHSHSYTGLLIFDSLHSATKILPTLVSAGASAIELMDATSLRVAKRAPSVPPEIADLDVSGHAALLVEFQGPELGEIRANVLSLESQLAAATVGAPTQFSTDPAHRSQLWHLRKGLYALVAGARPQGTTALLEDVVVPVELLAETCVALEQLFDQFGYQDAVIFGHAKDGNIHFMLTDDFSLPSAQERFAQFTLELVDLILKAGGSLKAEHGTGQVMAPFVRRQYGDFLYRIMEDIKTVCDPQGILNPGVILTQDESAHLKDFKPVTSVAAEVDTCVECGYCEPVCPSKNLTLTPRQRIVLSREISHAQTEKNTSLVKELKKGYGYSVVDTCAVDGMCQVACPLDINTGNLVRTLRQERAKKPVNTLWSAAARHWGLFTQALSVAMTVSAILPVQLIRIPMTGIRRLFGSDNLPLLTPDLPHGGIQRSTIVASNKAPVQPSAIYLPSCQGAMFASTSKNGPLQDSLSFLSQLAGVGLVVPSEIDSLCCGTPWKSKGMRSGYATMKDQVTRSLIPYANLNIPVVSDASSCAEGLSELLALTDTQVQDSLQFVVNDILPFLPPLGARPLQSMTVHPTCSMERSGTSAALLTIANHIAYKVEVPTDWGCCGFAGDRGMLHPELTASATAFQAKQIKVLNSEVHASNNRTCEIGMTRATGFEYQNIIELLAQAYKYKPV